MNFRCVLSHAFDEFLVLIVGDTLIIDKTFSCKFWGLGFNRKPYNTGLEKA